MKPLSKLYLLLLLFLPLTHAFAINFVMCPPIVLSILIGFCGLFIFSVNSFSIADINVTVLVLLLSSTYLLGDCTVSQTGHMSAYVIFFIFNYVLCKRVLFRLISKNPSFLYEVFRTLSFMLFITCFIGIVDWVSMNFLGNELAFPRSEGGGVGSAFGYMRARSFFNEPGTFASFILGLSPLCFLYIWRSKKSIYLKLIYVSCILSAFVLTFSSKGFLLIAIQGIILLKYKRGNRLKSQHIVLIITILITSILVLLYSDIGNSYANVISRKFIGSGIFDSRMGRGTIIMSEIKGIHWIFGYGPASYKTLGFSDESFLSGYAFILGDAGLLGLILFLGFLIWHLKHIIKIKDKGLQTALLCSFFFFATGEIIGPEHYSPSLYLVMAIIAATSICTRKLNLYNSHCIIKNH